MNYFQSHFKIIQKNFRSKQHRMDSEAFFIRMNKPSLDKQEELTSKLTFLETGMSYFSFFYALLSLFILLNHKILDLHSQNFDNDNKVENVHQNKYTLIFQHKSNIAKRLCLNKKVLF
jgi:hypothetical protein